MTSAWTGPDAGSGRRRRLAAALVLVVAAGLAGCGGDDDDREAAPTTTTAEPGPRTDDGGDDAGATFGSIEVTEPDAVFADEVRGYDFRDVAPDLGLQIVQLLRRQPAVDEAATGYAGRLVVVADEGDGGGVAGPPDEAPPARATPTPVAVVVALAYEPGQGAADALRDQLLAGEAAEVTLAGQRAISTIDPLGQYSIAYVGEELAIWAGGEDQQLLRTFVEALYTSLSTT